MEGAALTIQSLLTEYLPAFAGAIIGVWDSLIEFIMDPTNSVIWIGLLSFLFVMASKGLRSLIPGL